MFSEQTGHRRQHAFFAGNPFRKEQFAKVKEKSAEMRCKSKVCGQNFC